MISKSWYPEAAGPPGSLYPVTSYSRQLAPLRYTEHFTIQLHTFLQSLHPIEDTFILSVLLPLLWTMTSQIKGIEQQFMTWAVYRLRR